MDTARRLDCHGIAEHLVHQPHVLELSTAKASASRCLKESRLGLQRDLAYTALGGVVAVQFAHLDDHLVSDAMRATKISNGSHLALDGIKIAVLNRLLIQNVVNLGKATRSVFLKPRKLLLKRHSALGKVDSAGKDDVRVLEHGAARLVLLQVRKYAAKVVL